MTENQSSTPESGEAPPADADHRERRILVTGAAGMLGSQVLLAVPDDVTVLGTDMRDAPGVEVHGVDLTDEDQVSALFRDLAPLDGVIHTAAYTAVDKAEEEPDVAQAINGDACGVLARAAREAGVPLVVVSTDFVFDGTRHEPYDESVAPNPGSVYGRTKLHGER